MADEKKFSELTPFATTINASDLFCISKLNGSYVSKGIAWQIISDEIDKKVGGSAFDYFLTDTASDIGSYTYMFPEDPQTPESTVAASITADPTLIHVFVTEVDEPFFTTLVEGVYDVHVHAAKTVGTQGVVIYAEIYKRETGGTEILLATTEFSSILTAISNPIDLHFSITSEIELAQTDRIVLKFYGKPIGVGTAPTATIYIEGTNASRLELKTTSQAVAPVDGANIYWVRKNGNDSNNGKSWEKAFADFPQAMTAVSNSTPSFTNQFSVICLDGGDFASNFTIPQYCHVFAPHAKITAQVTVNSDSTFKVREFKGTILNGTQSGGQSGAVVEIDDAFDNTGVPIIDIVSGNAASIEIVIINTATITNVAAIRCTKNVSMKAIIKKIRYYANGVTGIIMTDGIVDLTLGRSEKPGATNNIRRADISSAGVLYLYQNSPNVADLPDVKTGVLQEITRETILTGGLTATNNLIVDNVNYTGTDGTTGQVLTTNGSGVTTFATIPTPPSTPPIPFVVSRIDAVQIWALMTPSTLAPPIIGNIPTQGQEIFTQTISIPAGRTKASLKATLILCHWGVNNPVGVAFFDTTASNSAIFYSRSYCRTDPAEPVTIEYPDYTLPATGTRTFTVRVGIEFSGRSGYLNRNATAQYGFGTMRSSFSIQPY